jgi:hypothetical protein
MLLNELFQEKVEEVSMSPGALKDFAATPFAQSMTAGFEAELIIPDVATDNVDEYDTEPDYDQDERIYSYEDIRNFFTGDYNSSREVDRAIENMQEEFLDEADPAFEDEMKDDILNYIRAAAKDDGMSEEEIDTIIQDGTDNSDYEKYLDDAKDEFRTDFYDNYFERWIRNNYRTMQSFGEAFDLTWPHWTEARRDSIGETDIDEVANQIEGAIGMKVKGSSGYHSTKRGTDFFILEPDSSIDADEDKGEAGLELVSPPMPLTQCLEYLDSVFKWANAYGCRTDSSTGFHMGISIPDQTIENVDHLKFILFLGDEYVLQQFNRENNTYASSMYKKITTAITQSNNDPAEILNSFKQGMNSIAAKTVRRLIVNKSDRFVTVNIKPNYIEVRSAGGDYLNELDKIKNTLLRYVRTMGLAADPEAEKQEYAKKLYKMLAPTVKSGEENIIQYFSQYSAGTLPAAALKSFIKQAQMKRAGKKDGAATNAALTAIGASGASSIPDSYRMVDRNNGYLASINADTLFDAYTRARRIATTAQLASNAWRLIDPNGRQVWPDPGPSSATTSSPASTAGTYVVTYRSPIDGEQRTAIDANSASEAEEWFKSNHPTTYQILNVSTPIQRR